MTRRVGIDIHAIGQRQTGNETYIANLIAQFATMQRPWTCVLYHTLPAESLDRRGQPAEFHRVRPHSPLLRIPLSFPCVLARDRIDLAHFQYVSPPLSPCPTIVTVHDISYELFPEYFNPLARKRMQWLIPRSARRAAHVLTVSEFSRRSIIERYGIPEDRITATPLGTSPAFRRLDPDEAQRVTARFGLTRPFILAVGNLQPRKNLERLLQAFARLREECGPGLELVLAGQVSWRGHRVEQEAQRLGLLGNVRLTGYVSQDELVALYNRALVFAYPSTFEGFGLPVLEAMACETPVLTSNVSSLPEVAGEAALQVDPFDVAAIADGLKRLVEDTSLRVRLIALGQQQVRRFDWRRTAEATADVYERALCDGAG
ncbi:MAG: glycosyltransferase family 4 protein [Burkholderiaceae bacterium]|nr:glycosyltransferase family 4 protein [Burkholderiaceae bacterium]MEB2350095.1 glycosyltransferase family 1 protein [Burkholderiaceae bacterium]